LSVLIEIDRNICIEDKATNELGVLLLYLNIFTFGIT